jgi:Replication initiator protein, pSAM2
VRALLRLKAPNASSPGGSPKVSSSAGFCPPPLSPQVLSGIPEGACSRFCCAGRANHIDGGTGELIHRYTTVHEARRGPADRLQDRHASRCLPCAEVYRADTYQLIRAGLSGGKEVPATVADHPCVFVTLTAPSFGPVHSRREKDGRLLGCRPRRSSRTGRTHSRRPDASSWPLSPPSLSSSLAVSRSLQSVAARSAPRPRSGIVDLAVAY